MSSKSFAHTHYINSVNPDAATLLGMYLSELITDFTLEPVFVCVGSDRVTGDSLGPMVGSWLKNKWGEEPLIYGTLETPVHALNLDEVMNHINSLHKNHPVIAIDASLGTKEHLGYITIGKGSLIPGAGVNKSLTKVGDFFITGIVGTAGRFSHLTLQTTRLSNVIAIAEQIALGIHYALDPAITPRYAPSSLVAATQRD